MDFERARFNMIEQQIRPWNVLDQDVLDMLSVVRREDFVPPAYRNMAFADLDLPLNLSSRSTGETMMSPKIEARLLQELRVRRSDSVLEIGTGSGYMAALLAYRAKHVESLEIDADLVRFASDNVARAAIANLTIRQADGSKGIADMSTFDVIVLSGSVPFVPDELIERLNPGGRLAAIVGKMPVMQALIMTRSAVEGTTSEVLFETVAKPLRGFRARESFTF
jgi:protein-L-isoaspartate(D-aspartate) O-methyltransferase